jgi:hypothetical protein
MWRLFYIRLFCQKPRRGTGLPDGIFSDQKSQFGLILEVLAMEDVGIFYRHLVYFTAI